MAYKRQTTNLALPLYDVENKWSFMDDWNKTAQKIDAGGSLTPSALVAKMEGASGISVDLNEGETKVAVGIDMTGAGANKVLMSDDEGEDCDWEPLQVSNSEIVATLVDSGKVLTADGSGNSAWQYPSATNFSSGSATEGQFLVANGQGGATWTTVPSANGVSF